VTARFDTCTDQTLGLLVVKLRVLHRPYCVHCLCLCSGCFQCSMHVFLRTEIQRTYTKFVARRYRLPTYSLTNWFS
jgi:hypothetical protein